MMPCRFFLLICFCCTLLFPLPKGQAASLIVNPEVEDGKILVFIKGLGGLSQIERSLHIVHPLESYSVEEGTKRFGTGFLHNYTNDLWFFALSKSCVWSGEGMAMQDRESIVELAPPALRDQAKQNGFSFVKDQRVSLRHVEVKADAKRWPLFEITLSKENSDNNCEGHNFFGGYEEDEGQ